MCLFFCCITQIYIKLMDEVRHYYDENNITMNWIYSRFFIKINGISIKNSLFKIIFLVYQYCISGHLFILYFQYKHLQTITFICSFFLLSQHQNR